MRRIALLLAGLTMVAGLAGCIGATKAPAAGVARHDARFGSGFAFLATDANGLPVPVPLCQPGQATALSPKGCNYDMTPTDKRQGNEVTIAVNPQDPRNVVGGAKDYFPTDAGQCVWDGIYVTHDGAATAFHDRSLDGSPWRLVADPAAADPQYTSQFWCTTDPVAYFSADGKSFYYLAMAYQADPVTGSKTCSGTCEMPDEVCALPAQPCGLPSPPGAACAAASQACSAACGAPDVSPCAVGNPYFPSGSANDWAFNRATQVVCHSASNGDAFDHCAPALEGGSYPYLFNDKGWIAASNDGVVHVMWLASEFGGNIYVRSTDGGRTFGAPTTLSNTPTAAGAVRDEDAGQGSFVDVGPQRQVYAAWTGPTLNLRASADEGLTWGPTQHVLSPHAAGMPGLSSRDRRGGAGSQFPALATDRNPDSPFANSVYFAFQDSCQRPLWDAGCPASRPSLNATAGPGENRANVYVVASHDGGATWGVPVRVNDDALPNGTADPDGYQIMPAISVSPGGVLDVQWFDTREGGMAPTVDGPAIVHGKVPPGTPHPRLDQYYSYSLDGGRTWSRNLRVRDAADAGWDPQLSHHQNGKVFIGDYQDIDSSWQAAHPVWPDTRDGQSVKVYTATLQRPWFAAGWDPAKKAAAEAFIAAHPLT